MPEAQTDGAALALTCTCIVSSHKLPTIHSLHINQPHLRDTTRVTRASSSTSTLSTATCICPQTVRCLLPVPLAQAHRYALQCWQRSSVSRSRSHHTELLCTPWQELLWVIHQTQGHTPATTAQHTRTSACQKGWLTPFPMLMLGAA